MGEPQRTEPQRTEPLGRKHAKAERSAQLLHAASHLFAERGYAAVSINDVGSAVGISGPALYRHFRSKPALLAEVLVDISERLLAGGLERAGSMPELIAFHADFSLSEPDRIRIYERDLVHIEDDQARHVRRLQRQYVDVWVDALIATSPDTSEGQARFRSQAVISLLNSTPHTMRTKVKNPRLELIAMAHGALGLHEANSQSNQSTSAAAAG